MAVKGVIEDAFDQEETLTERVVEVTFIDEKVTGVESPKDQILTQETFEIQAMFLECAVKKEKLSEYPAVVTQEEFFIYCQY